MSPIKTEKYKLCNKEHDRLFIFLGKINTNDDILSTKKTLLLKQEFFSKQKITWTIQNGRCPQPASLTP